MTADSNKIEFLGIPFWNAETDALLQEIDKSGGVLTVPSAPSLARAGHDKLLLEAYQSSTWSVVDGGYIALIVRWIFGKEVRRISGFQLIRRLFVDAHKAVPMQERQILWVVPNQAERARIEGFLRQQGFAALSQEYYLAPQYAEASDFRDKQFENRIRRLQPDWVVMAIGGGKQEKLALFAHRALDDLERKPVFLCTGAAISFFTGGQARIPIWADRYYIGWLIRIFENPKIYFPRYAAAAWQLPKILWCFRHSLWKRENPF